MSNYPDSIDTFAPVTGSDEMTEHAERHTAEESSIVAVENTLGTNPEGESDTVADRLDGIQEEIDGLPTPNVYRLETDANTRSVPQIQLVDQDDNFSDVVFNSGDGISITSVGSGLNIGLAEGVIYDDTELAAQVAANTEAISGIDTTVFATSAEVAEADQLLQGQIDAIETYDDTDLTATVDTKFTMGGTWGALAGRS